MKTTPRFARAARGERLAYGLLGTFLMAVVLLPAAASGQGTVADYERAMTLRDTYQNLAVHVPEQPTWIARTNRFWYRRTVRGGNDFVLVNAETQTKAAPFDHAKLAAGISSATGGKYTAVTLPFTTFAFVDNDRAIEFSLSAGGPGGGAGRGMPPGAPGGPPMWRCALDTYTCRPPATAGRGGRGGRGGGGLAGPVRPTFDVNGAEPRQSPDEKLEALVSNFNVAIREAGKREVTRLSTDGSEGGYYDPDSLVWSPDSTKIAVYKVTPGYRRYVRFVESSPEDQLQPKDSTMQYAKPGDVIDVERPVIFDVATKQQIVVDTALFPNAYDMSRLEWRKGGAAVTFEYNQRGHQLFRVIEIDGATGRARAVVNEEPKTFFCYSGKKFRRDVGDGKEIIWMSERDGWNHLYLYDGVAGTVKNQITKGDWLVREVVQVDEDKRQIWFSASGMYPGKDPYFVHYYRINFDGTGLTPLTTADANHAVRLSPDLKFYVDTYSRVDAAPVSELHRAADGSLAMPLEKGDITELVKAGWKPPEVFVAKGRDGTSDIWGVIFRPSTFDASKKYPVIENIYAGPQSSFVPKSFAAFNQMQAQAEIGFVVVQIDGMGTSNRSKAFHDVAWQNIKDAGFPDRILWHKAVAAKYPYYDITRVGLYGTSAGGQNSLGGLLFFPEFYKAAVSSAGCHDNRMDKIWWNEQWMGWPIGSQYAESSNVDNAYRLQGKVLLVVGEMDSNVDPSSTMQVVNQLIKHNKNFDLLVVPGMGHGSGGAYGDHKRYDFFARHLLDVDPPEWKVLDDAMKKRTPATTSSAAR
jgi:dipeptidyl aminopeptidase/acylaminoacyl peptidase